MLLIILVVLAVVAFGGGLAQPDYRNILWVIAAVLVVVWLVSVLR